MTRDLHEPQTPGKFRVRDRVRVKIGVYVGQLGTVSHWGPATRYGVKLDTQPRPIGFHESEIEKA